LIHGDHTDPATIAESDTTPTIPDVLYTDDSPLPPLTRRRLDLLINATPETSASLPQDRDAGSVDRHAIYSPVIDMSAHDIAVIPYLPNSNFCTDDLRASLFVPSVIIAQPPLHDIDLLDSTLLNDDAPFDKHIADS
jgi:hypothetical protein